MASQPNCKARGRRRQRQVPRRRAGQPSRFSQEGKQRI